MKKMLNRLFKHSQEPSQGTPSSLPGRHETPATIMDGSENGTRRQLVQVLLRDVLRRSGIPPAWIDCQMMLVSSRSKGSGMHVRLIVKHWDARLMNYLFAFQSELLMDIARFETNSSNWLHGISWQFEVENSCPFTHLPEQAFWADVQPKSSKKERQWDARDSTVVAKSTAFAATQRPEPLDSLKDLFATRDQEFNLLGPEGVTPVGYEKTQPAPLS